MREYFFGVRLSGFLVPKLFGFRTWRPGQGFGVVIGPSLSPLRRWLSTSRYMQEELSKSCWSSGSVRNLRNAGQIRWSGQQRMHQMVEAEKEILGDVAEGDSHHIYATSMGGRAGDGADQEHSPSQARDLLVEWTDIDRIAERQILKEN